MNFDQLRAAMLSFVAKQDNNIENEWYCTPHDLYADIMKEFATHVGIGLVVPPKAVEPRPDIDRREMLESLLPEMQRLFNIEYKKREAP